MSVETKKRKKPQVLETETQSQDEFDRIRSTLQVNILQHNQSRKLEILRAAQEYESRGYPKIKICDRITKDLQGPKYETSGSYVRKVLPPKYKDPEQMATALKQNTAGDTNNRHQQKAKSREVINSLKDQLKAKDKQIEDKTKEIEDFKKTLSFELIEPEPVIEIRDKQTDMRIIKDKEGVIKVQDKNKEGLIDYTGIEDKSNRRFGFDPKTFNIETLQDKDIHYWLVALDYYYSLYTTLQTDYNRLKQEREEWKAKYEELSSGKQ